MARLINLGWCVVALGGLAACAPDYSPNTYAASAVQQANKVDPGVIVGLRSVDVTAGGVIGAATGAAAGGIAGAQTPGGAGSAFGAIGGALVGGLVGTSVEHAVDDTTAYEYVVRKKTGDLVSVTQKDKSPLAVGTKVLVIAGPQARIVPDYTVATDAPTPPADKAKATPPAGSPPAAGAAVPPVASSPSPAPSGTSAAAATNGNAIESVPLAPAATPPTSAAAAASMVEKAFMNSPAARGAPTDLLPPPTSLTPAATPAPAPAPASTNADPGTTTNH